MIIHYNIYYKIHPLYINFIAGDLKLVEMTLTLNASIAADLSDAAVYRMYEEIMKEMVRNGLSYNTRKPVFGLQQGPTQTGCTAAEYG